MVDDDARWFKDAVYLLSGEPDPVKACPPSVTLGTGLLHTDNPRGTAIATTR